MMSRFATSSQALKSHVDADDLQKLEITDALGRPQRADGDAAAAGSVGAGAQVAPSVPERGTPGGLAGPTDAQGRAARVAPI
jgi:hypothetical protein